MIVTTIYNINSDHFMKIINEQSNYNFNTFRDIIEILDNKNKKRNLIS